MSQKSSDPQAISFVSQPLKRDMTDFEDHLNSRKSDRVSDRANQRKLNSCVARLADTRA